MDFAEAVRGLMAGDFSRLAPLFEQGADGSLCSILSWYESGLFTGQSRALDEAFSCACFNGCTQVVEYFLNKGVNPNGGACTGLNAFHWAANRGQLKVVEILLRNNALLETRNAYGGTVLGGTVWSAVHESKPQHLQIIKTLLNAGALVSEAEYPSGDDSVDEVLRQHGAGT